MNTKSIVYIIILSAITLTSCRTILIELLIKDKSAIKKIRILEKDDKEIIYVPIVHIGTERYYREIKEFLEHKRADGYTIYYEGVTYGESNISLEEKYILDLKLRRLLGFHLTALNNTQNHSLPDFVNNSRNTYQSKENIGIDTLADINIDLTRQELVYLYESEYDKIHLDTCDFNTPLLEKYSCSKGDAYYKVVYSYRDKALIGKLLKSKHNRIVLVFGKSHWIKSIYPKLVNKNGFELVYGKI